MRTAGILAYPPKMQQEILAWVKSLYATWAATRARVEIKGYKEEIREFKEELKEATTPREVAKLNDRIELWQEGIDRSSKVLKVAIQDGAKGRGRKKSQRDFVTNLEGMPKNYPIEQLQREIPKIRVGVEFTGQPAPRGRALHGQWNGNTKKLRILLHGRAPDQVFKYREAARTMDTIIQHELRHMVQQMFFQFEAELMTQKILERGKSWEDLSPREQEHIRKSISRGSPKEYEVGSFALYEDIPKDLQYYLRPQEFFTWLGQSEGMFLDEVRSSRVVSGGGDPRPTKKEFDQFVGNPRPIKSKGRIFRPGDPIATHPFFATLWEYDRKRWQRAVRELWKRVQNKLVLPPTKLPPTKRVASRYLTARMAERVARRYLVARVPMGQLLRDFVDGWDRVNEEIDDKLLDFDVTRADFLAGRLKGMDEYDIRTLARRLTSIGKIWWPRMLRAAKLWVDYLLLTKAIPRGQAKKFELAARPFAAARRSPRDVVAWMEKNKRNYQYLTAAAKWPDKVENGAGVEDVFTIGPFKVHNTVQETGEKLSETKKVIEYGAKHLRGSRIPGLAKTLYGDVFIVGRLAQPRTLAWYSRSDDKLYLRPHLKVGKGELHNFLHELGHRYWGKFMSRDAKSKWATRHFLMKHGYAGFGPQEVSEDLPEIGKPLPIPMKGMKRGGPPVVTKIDPAFIHVLHEATGREAKILKTEYFKFLRGQAKRAQFPTPYASKDAEEHFCEALAMYLMGALADPHKAAFDAVVIRGKDAPGMPARVARMYLAERYGPSEQLTEAVRYRVKANPKGIVVAAYVGRQKVGHVVAFWSLSAKACAKDVEQLREKYPDVDSVLVVDKAYLDEPMQGKGVGRAMYEAMMGEGYKRKGAFLFVPTECWIGSGTSPQAKRVWISLGRKYPSSGRVVAVLRAPRLPSTTRVARMYLAKRFTPEAWKEYKRKHPKADPKRHEIVRPEKKEAPKPKKTVRQKLDHVLSGVKGLSKSVARSVREAPEKVQRFIVDDKYRDEVTKAAAKAIKEAPGKLKRAVIQSGKAELKAIFKETPRILATLVKERRAPTKEEAKTLYGVGVYVAGTILAMTTGGPAGGALGRAAMAGAKAFGHSLSLHIGIKAMNRFADEGFLAYEAAESIAQAGGISAVLPVSTSDLPGLGQIWDAVSTVITASDEKLEPTMDNMIEQLIKIIGEELEKGLTDDEIVKILKEERP